MKAAYDILSSAGALLGSLGTPSETSPRTLEDKFALEPLSLIVSLATASLMPDGIKPIYINHHIKWGVPDKASLPAGVSVSLQGVRRTCTNIAGSGIATRKVISVWEETIRKALVWYEPHKRDNQNIKDIFSMAILGLDKVNRSYEGETDDTQLKLTNCITVIRDGIKSESPIIKEVQPGDFTARIKALWDEERMRPLCKYFAEIKVIQEDRKPGYESALKFKINAIQGIVDERCWQFGEILRPTY